MGGERRLGGVSATPAFRLRIASRLRRSAGDISPVTHFGIDELDSGVFAPIGLAVDAGDFVGDRRGTDLRAPEPRLAVGEVFRRSDDFGEVLGI